MNASTQEQGTVLNATTESFDREKLQKQMLVKGDQVKVIRLSLPAGQELKEHKAPGEITVHCIAGQMEFECCGKVQSVSPNQFIYLRPGELHAVKAVTDCVFLLTICG